MKNKIKPVHPGEILLEEFLKPMDITQYRLAKDLGLPISRINQIVLSNRAITAATALLLSKYFGLSEDYWLNLQNRYDLEIAKDTLKEKLKEIKRAAVKR
jgi:addiction module HigA family antidote